MSIQLEKENGGSILNVHLTGKLTKQDYELFVPEFERLLREHGKPSVLFDMSDFHGWEAGALWEDMKFDIKHFTDIEKIAMVGHKKWEKGMAMFCKPFTTASIRYFDEADVAGARKWLEESLTARNRARHSE